MVSVRNLAIPKAKQTQLINKGLETTEDLLRMTPLHVYDFSIHTPIRELKHGDVVAVHGEVSHKQSTPKYTKFIIEDNTGVVDVFVFGQAWVAKKFNVGDTVTVGGKIKKQGYFTSFSNLELFEKGKVQKIYTKYSKIKGMSDDYLIKCIRMAEQHPVQEKIEREVRKKFGLVDATTLTQCIHHPRNMEDVKRAKRRLIFEELFAFDLKLFANRKRLVHKDIPKMNNFEKTEGLKKSLPFELTNDQNKVLRQISGHFLHGKRLNTLVQGDVGSGKTMVGLFALLIAAENGHQGVLMAPTTVLAQQHYEEAVERLSPLGLKVSFINGGLKVKERREILKSIASGETDVVIGTHAAISKDVHYHSLRVVVIDEEHRFGVEQRESLEAKASEGAHKISLTATPIPRTLAHTLFGDDVRPYEIKSMPSGRKQILTNRGDSIQGLNLLRAEINKGHQGYIVCPLIEDNEDINAKSVLGTFKKTKDFFKREDIKVGMVHGKMKQEKIDEEIEKFINNEYDILVSTTIIEVGVNVPNTTVMIIESADRFGLSQLHQLRGRVGRSSFQSYCLLTSEEDITEDAHKKLDVLVGTTDGFRIAEADMEIRGTGNLVGIEQTGDSRAIDIMISYPKFSQNVKNEVLDILRDPIRLSNYHYLFDRQEVNE